MKPRKHRQSTAARASAPPKAANGGRANAEGASQPPPRVVAWILGLLLVAAIVMVYQPVWRAGFIWDDDVYVTNNPLLTAPDGLSRIWFSTDSPSQYFPLTYTVFRWEHSLWGFNAASYHWVNILLHAVNALLVWRLLKRLEVPGAWLAAAIFALHPIQVETVAWITECKNLLMCGFFLLSLLCWIEFIGAKPVRRWWFYLLTLLFYLLALFGKTTACTLPAALLLILWLKREPIRWMRLAQIAPFLAIGAGMGSLTVWWERFHQGTQGKSFSLGLMERILVASHAVWFYLAKLLWPVNLTFSYPKWAIHLNDPLVYVWMAAGVGACALIYWGRRYAGRSVEVAALFFVATLSPVLGFVMLFTFRYTFVADHYQYVAGIGVIALVAAGITVGLRRKPALKIAVSGVLLLTLAVLTWRQCRMYSDGETLWRATIERNPASWLAQDDLGDILLHEGRLDEAMDHFNQSIAIQPENASAHDNLGNILLQRRQVDEAMAQFQEALAIQPDYAGAYINLGSAFLQKGQDDQAMIQFQKALDLEPKNARALYDMGNALLQAGQADQAIVQFQKALAIQPGYADVENNLGNALLQKRDIAGAIVHYQAALALRPDYAEAEFNLGNALLQEQQADEAMTHFQKALEIRPDYAKAHAALGDIQLHKGNVQEAMAHYQTALQLNPNFVMVLNNLAWTLATHPDANIRNGAQAVQYAERACALTRDTVPAFLNTLAAAYAEAGRFDEAVATAQKAQDGALAAGQSQMAASIGQLVELYKAGKPYHVAAPAGH